MAGALSLSSLWGLLFLPMHLLGITRGVLTLLLAIIFKGPRWVFGRKVRGTRPPCMEDPKLGTHRYIKLKDVTLHVVESGDPKKPLMLFLHGFLECWYAWRYQIAKFNKDFHCVAVDMRGAGESEAIQSAKSYDLDTLHGDIVGLIQAFGHTSCVLVGHDLGGMIGYDFAAKYPEMVDKFVVLNAAHPDKYSELTNSFFLAHLWRAWYVFFFQWPKLPELMISMGDYEPLRQHCLRGPATDEDMEAFKYAISRPGILTAYLNYYRRTCQDFMHPTGQVDVPTLFVWGTDHPSLHNKLVKGTGALCPRATIEMVKGGDLLLNQSQPDLVNRLMHDYLKQ